MIRATIFGADRVVAVLAALGAKYVTGATEGAGIEVVVALLLAGGIGAAREAGRKICLTRRHTLVT